MKRISIKQAESKPEVDKAKRVYRAMLDTIRKLDDIIKQKKAYREVFLPDAINLRNKLCDYCERLMFYDPLEYGRKAEELLWRKVYYDIIQLMKHNRKQMKPNSSLESAFRTHLVSAMGYYHHLLFRLQQEYHIQMDGIVDFYLVPEPRAHKKAYNPKKGDPDQRMIDWALRACHRCLHYLGDIARYQQDYDDMGSTVLSQRYYYQALTLFPDMGMPHNQLGTLAGSRYYNIDAAYHYLRCLTCQSPFEGAQGNLARLLEKNRRRHLELTQLAPHAPPPDQPKHVASKRTKDIKRFIVRFLHLIDIFYGGTNKVDSKGLQESCQATLQDFNLCMFYQPSHVTNPGHDNDQITPDDRPQVLEDEVVIKVVVMCMMAVLNLQYAGNKQMTAAIAFSLALFSHVLNHVVIRLQSALYELENPRKTLNGDSPVPYDLGVGEENDKDTDQGSSKSQEKSDDKHDKLDTKCESKRHRLTKMRRRRRRRRIDSECTVETASTTSGDDSDLSEGGDIEVASDSDSEEETINYLHVESDSSDSDTEDNLMVSQELRPGFCSPVPGSIHGDCADTLEDTLDGLQQSCIYNTVTFGSDTTGSLANGLSTNSEDALNDITEYLKGLPTDFMSNPNNFFNQMRLASLLQQGGAPLREEDPLNDADLKAVVQGKKEVRVPPGFEQTADAKHVLEITEKLADFVIETDTDMSSMPTDTENSSLPTESELETETTETDRESAESVIDKNEVEERHLERLVQVISAEGLLKAIKMYCDWMSCHPHIIATCAQSSKSLWSRLAVLLNFLPLEADMAREELCESDTVLTMVEQAATRDWSPVEPLSEDLHLQKFPALLEAHQTLHFNRTARLNLSNKQEALMRICCLRRFGYQVARMKSIQFTYDPDKAMFLGPLQLEGMQDEKMSTEKRVSSPEAPIATTTSRQARLQAMGDAEARRNQLMRDMAQLRLQAEVSQLEGSLQSADQPSLPPYLVPDASALCDNLAQVRSLAQSARFIMIIPLAVIDHLDLLKKGSTGAREAIRWLETEFRKGNRYVRAQKTHEKVSAVPHKNLKKRDKDAWRVLQVTDCCTYLSQQSCEWDSKGLVCILSSLDINSPDLSVRVRQAFAAAQQEGLLIHNVAEFFNRWKDLWKTNKG